MSHLNTDSNEDENSSRNFSPTPTPRRKLLIKVINKDSEDEKIFCIMPSPSDIENLILNDSTSPCTNNSDTNATFLTNLTSTDLELDLEQPRKQSFMSSTMPTPRKPRKKFYNADTINPRIRANKEANKNDSSESSFEKNASPETPTMNKTAPGYINDTFFAFNNYGNSRVPTPALSLISSSSTPKFAFNQTEDYENNSSYETDYLISKMREEYAFDKFHIDTKSIQKLIEPSTLRIDRGNDLKRRPTAPPPPLPKQPPPLFEKLNFMPIENHAFTSSTPYFFRNQASEAPASSVQIHNETTPKSSFKSLKRNFSNEMRNNCQKQTPIGFERLAQANEAANAEHPIAFRIKKVKALLESRSSSSGFVSKLKSKFLNLNSRKKIFKRFSALNFLIGFFVLALFTFCITCIIVFQTQVHQFYRRFLNTTQSNSSNHTEYFIAGSSLVNRTVLICNGPYFSYQVNNLFVLPFSLLLVVIFSFFSKRDSCCASHRGALSCGSRPGLPSSHNPFQRRNRFFAAALFCILANEIFKMIESSMFESTASQSPFNTTGELINSALAKNWSPNSSLIQAKFKHVSSNTDFLRVGLGIEPFLLSKETTLATTTPLATSNKPAFAFAPSIVTYSKPRLPPRLHVKDFLTTTTTSTTKSLELNDNLTMAIVDGVKIFRSSHNKTSDIVNSFNRSLDGSSSKTLYELSVSLYRNEYVQGGVQRLFQAQAFKWTIIVEKLETFGFMMFEVLIIGMRYYPMLGVMDKNSIVCLMLASVYMWADTLYNVAITGLCEGLKLNVSFDLLKDIRRVFGVGFIMDVKERMKMNKLGLFDEQQDQEVPIDAQLLFSTSRIVYSIVKSLPHFFCLSYVAVRLTAALLESVYFKLRKCGVLSSKRKPKNDPKTYEYSNYVIDANANANANKKLNLIYTKMAPEDAYTNYSSLIIRNRLSTIEYLRKSKLSFEERYVKSVFKNSSSVKPNEEKGLKHLFGWVFDENFRFSTRAVCTYTVCFTVLYYLTCFLMFYGSIFVDMIYLPSIYKQTIVLSTCVTSLICLAQLVLSIKQFKLHLKSLYKGTSDQYISPKSAFSNKKIATSSFNYSGYAVTYMCWGYIILFALLTVVSFQLIFFGGNSIGLFVLLVLLPFVVSILIVKFINKFIGSLAAKFCFLQSKSKVLALKNVKCYSIFLYFKFFYDCFTGFAYCMLRIMTSIVLSVVFLPRLDYSFMGRSLEGMDTAFMSYVGYLHWESHHTNPVVICFCDMLKRNLKINNKLKKYNIVQNKTRTRVRNRWYLLYLMSKNLQLVQYRRR